jgi:hypothetical protein
LRNLFDLIVDQNSVHPNFKALAAADRSELKKVVENWAEGFVDRDGNDKFRKEFQTTFNSSFWELYLFAVFKKLGFKVDFDHNAPDFVLGAGLPVVEAVVANASQNDVAEWQKTFEGITNPDVTASQMATVERLSNSIASKTAKYQKSYGQLDHVKERPFIIALASYATQDFFQLGDVAAQRLFYDDEGLGEIRKRNGATLDVGIFSKEEFADVSAVIFSMTATIGKVRALSKSIVPAQFQAFRIKNLIEPIHIFESSETYTETLCDGLRVFHNPNAKRPLDPSVFSGDPDIMQYCYDEAGRQFIICSEKGDLAMRQVIVFSQF